MLLLVAWRNLRRNSRRTIIVLVSIIVGVVSLLLYDSISYGMIRQMLDNSVGASIGHIQIHGKGYNDNRVIQTSIPDRLRAENAVRGMRGVRAWSSRVPSFGLLSSAQGSSGGVIVGVDAHSESRVSSIASTIVKGRYLEGEGREVVIGRALAGKLHVDVGDKVVGMASTRGGEVGSELFRVVGLFETVSADFDKTHMFVPMSSAQEMLGMGGDIIEIAIVLEQPEQAERVAADLRAQLGPDYEVLTYRELVPLLVAQLEMYDQMLVVIYVIIGLAMIFGIINTMLMSVFERVQEFGVLMAIGMRNAKVFSMVMIEALYLAMIGTVVGVLAGVALTLLLREVGIDLSVFSEGLRAFGAGAVITPELRFNGILAAVITIPLTTLLGALYPAWKATRLLPVTAIRHV